MLGSQYLIYRKHHTCKEQNLYGMTRLDSKEAWPVGDQVDLIAAKVVPCEVTVVTLCTRKE
jgi:hypothetical protein